MVIVDYVQLMQGRGKFENRTLELGSISRPEGARQGTARADRAALAVEPRARVALRSSPQLSDLRESGALEQDADVVAFIYREDMYMDKSQPPTDAQGTAELIIAKQRNGPVGVVKLAFIREFTRFENLAAGGA
jgi:Replicative DNA helicase